MKNKYNPDTTDTHEVLTEEIEIDQIGNEKIIHKIIEKDEPREIPSSNKLNQVTIVNSESIEEMNKHSVYLDENSNIINENDVETKDEEYIDENGIKKQRRISVIKEDAFEKI
jgi:hypothetical protein